MKKSVIFILVCSISIISFILYAKNNKISNEINIINNYKYINPTPGEITILAATSIPETKEASRYAFEELIKCGFNIGGIRGDIKYLKHQFSLAEGLDFKFLLTNEDFKSNYYKELVNKFKDESQLGGWVICDEPLFDKLYEVKNNYDSLYKIDPSHLIYVNLIGSLNNKSTGPAKNFGEYLDIIQNILKPSLWSYDLYPMSVNNGRLNVDYNLFFSDLENVFEISKKTYCPFWAFCQGMGFKNKVIERPVPTEPYLRFEAFSALAYGAQGIVYWTYGQRKSNSLETYYSALVDLNGEKTKAWYAAQKVNLEIKKFNDIFYECTVKEIRHTGDRLYKDTKKLTGSFGPFSKVETGSSGALFSCLSKGSNDYIVIVNHDVTKSQKISLILKEDRDVDELTGHSKNKKKNGRKIDFSLPKGDWAIFLIK